MPNVTGSKFARDNSLTRDINEYIRSGTHIESGKQFLNEHR